MTMLNDAWAEIKLNALTELGTKQWTQEINSINLIASDNAYPTAWTDRPLYRGHIIQEGLVDNRPFAGAVFHDDIERLGQDVAKKIFGAGHANLQPHSCSQANQAAYHALLKPGDGVCALSFGGGGHLTHGLKQNFSGRFYRFTTFSLGVDYRIDYDLIRDEVRRSSPKLIVFGSSANPRMFDGKILREIADEFGTYLMFDLSHEAGLIAGGALDNPIQFADIVTMSLDKTLRGPFGAVILGRAEFASRIDRAVHPGTQSSFSVRRLVDSIHALLLTQTNPFRTYARQTIENCQSIAEWFINRGAKIITDGTDKHYLILDTLSNFGLTGVDAEGRLEQAGVLVSRQSIPSDLSARINNASGIRIGSAWATSRGYGLNDFECISEIILSVLKGENAPETLRSKASELARLNRPNDAWDASNLKYLEIFDRGC